MPNDTSDAATDNGILLKIDANVELLSEDKENIPEDNFNANVPNVKNADIEANENSKVDLSNKNNEKILGEELVDQNLSLTLATPNKIQEDDFSTSIKNTEIVPNKDSKDQDLLSFNDDSLNFAKPSLPIISKADAKMETPENLKNRQELSINTSKALYETPNTQFYGTPNETLKLDEISSENRNETSLEVTPTNKFVLNETSDAIICENDVLEVNTKVELSSESNENIPKVEQADVNKQQLLINSSLQGRSTQTVIICLKILST